MKSYPDSSAAPLADKLAAITVTPAAGRLSMSFSAPLAPWQTAAPSAPALPGGEDLSGPAVTARLTGKKGIEDLKVTVCIGSSCHIKGSRSVVEQLQQLVQRENLSGSVELAGSFCMGKCQQGVCVTVDGEFFSVSPETVSSFFEKEIKARV